MYGFELDESAAGNTNLKYMSRDALRREGSRALQRENSRIMNMHARGSSSKNVAVRVSRPSSATAKVVIQDV